MKKDIILFACIFTVLCLIAGGTYAYWTWISDTEKSVVFTTAGIEDYIIYDEGESHFVGNFQPSSNHCGGISNTISFSINTENLSDEELANLSEGRLMATIYMDVNAIGSNIASSNKVYWTIHNSTSCSVNSWNNYGTFNGVSAGDTIELLSSRPLTTDTETYTIRIWIDSSGSNLSSLSGDTIDVNIWTQIDLIDSSVCRIYYSAVAFNGEDNKGYSWYQDITEGEQFEVAGYTGGKFYSASQCVLVDGDNTFLYPGRLTTASCGTRFSCFDGIWA